MASLRANSLVYVIFATIFVTSQAANFAVTAPNIFRINVPETIGISLIDYPKAVTVQVQLQTHPNRGLIAQRSLVVQNGIPQITTLTVPESAIPAAQQSSEVILIYLVVTAPNGDFSKKEAIIHVKKYSGYVLVQTDKPLYTPKDTVKIRVLNLNEQLTPSDKQVLLEINNPNGTTILSEKLQPSDTGFIHHSTFTFSTFPVYGYWSVSIKYGMQMSGKKTVRFLLKEYELPTFSVKIEAPKVIVNTNKRIETKIVAKYVYGKNVDGYLNVKFGIKVKDRIVQIGSHQLLPINGEKWVTINVEKDIKQKNIVWFPEVNGAHFVIEAEVVERATGNSESAIDHSSIFSYSPYTISFPRSSLHFKPGVVYQVQVDVNLINGNDKFKIPVPVVKAVSKKSRQILRHLRIPTPTTTNHYGHVMYELGTNTDDEQLEITLATADPNLSDENQAKNTIIVNKFQSPDGKTYVWIPFPPDEKLFSIGKWFQTNVHVYPSGEDVKLQYMVVSRGVIVLQGETAKQKNAHVHLVQFTVTADMSPSARLIVFIIKNNKIVADSVKFYVEKVFKYNNGSDLIITAQTTAGFFKPGEQMHITVTGERDSNVGLLIVDESVYLLSEQDLLTRKSMFDEMDAHDLGCGPGGAENSGAVFRKAGFRIISDATINEHSRIAGECETIQRKKRSVSAISQPKMEDSYSGNAAICCRIGRLAGPLGLNCTQRAKFIYDAIGDAENCSEAFLDCCEKHTAIQANTMTIVRSALNNVEEDFDDNELIEMFEDNLLKNIRKYFYESWIFNTYKIGRTDCIKGNENVCKLKITTNIPHTITSWRVQAVAISKQTGTCVAEPINLVVFKSVFIEMKLPYSAARMEQIQLPITVFNYRDEEIKVTVYMFGVKGVCMGAGPGERSETHKITIPANNASTVTFPIMPLEVGSYKLRAIALTGSAGDNDAIEKTLLVVPPGVPTEKYLTITLDPQGVIKERRRRSSSVTGIDESYDTANNRHTLKIDTPMPKLYVPGTEICEVSVIGELLSAAVSTSIQGLESRFLVLPSGCGEQTMSTFEPLVHSMLYLQRSGQLSSANQNNGYSLIRNGLANMLSYERNGAFSVYRGRPPAVWLTARAAKTICQAKSLISTNYNPCNSFDWMSSQNYGGSESWYTNAYVLIAAVQCSSCSSSGRNSLISRTKSRLESQVDSMNDAYTLSYTTYALKLANSYKASSSNERLKSMASFDQATSTRFWGNFNHQHRSWTHANRASAASIATTSYALLVQILFGNIVYAHPIANWLNQQKNQRGFFASTQDTLIAIQALSEYSINAKFAPLHFAITISNQVSNVRKSFTLTKGNSLSTQKFQMPCQHGIHIDAQGTGIATVSVVLHYNVETNKNEKCKFDLKIKSEEIEEKLAPRTPQPEFETFNLIPKAVIHNITTSQDQAQKFGYTVHDAVLFEVDYGNVGYESHHFVKLEICVRFLENKPTGMSILDIGLYTGYTAVKEDLQKLVDDKNSSVAQYEHFNSSVILYLDSVPHNKDLCVKLRTIQEISIGRVRPAIIKVYDYYEPDKSCEKSYQPDGTSEMVSAVCKGTQCRCVEAQCPPKFPFSKLLNIRDSTEQRNKLLQYVCDRQHIAWNGTFLRKTEENGFTKYHIRVNEVLKQGIQTSNSLIKKTIIFTGTSGCSTPEMTIGKSYIIINPDGLPYKDEISNVDYKYTFNRKTSVYEMRLLREVMDEKQRELQKSFHWLYKRLAVNRLGCSDD